MTPPLSSTRQHILEKRPVARNRKPKDIFQIREFSGYWPEEQVVASSNVAGQRTRFGS
jgi:hypothetical protein